MCGGTPARRMPDTPHPSGPGRARNTVPAAAITPPSERFRVFVSFLAAATLLTVPRGQVSAASTAASFRPAASQAAAFNDESLFSRITEGPYAVDGARLCMLGGGVLRWSGERLDFWDFWQRAAGLVFCEGATAMDPGLGGQWPDAGRFRAGAGVMRRYASKLDPTGADNRRSGDLAGGKPRRSSEVGGFHEVR